MKIRRVTSGIYVCRHNVCTFRIIRAAPKSWTMTQRKGGRMQYETAASSKRELLSFVEHLSRQAAL